MYFKILSVLSTILFTITLSAQKPVIFQHNGKAIHGYDVVSYQQDSGPVKGADSLTLQWENATWFFSSAANLEAFKQNPEKYVPQFGGYCAYGMAGGYKAPTEADAWTVVNGLLYFNYNKKVRDLWNKDREGFIQKANKNWPEIKTK